MYYVGKSEIQKKIIVYKWSLTSTISLLGGRDVYLRYQCGKGMTYNAVNAVDRWCKNVKFFVLQTKIYGVCMS